VRYSIIPIVIFDFRQSIADARLYRRDESLGWFRRLERSACLKVQSAWIMILANRQLDRLACRAIHLNAIATITFPDRVAIEHPRLKHGRWTEKSAREIRRYSVHVNREHLFLFYIRDPYTWTLNIHSYRYAFLLRMSSRLKLCW
jgi:hypothetical protein